MWKLRHETQTVLRETLKPYFAHILNLDTAAAATQATRQRAHRLTKLSQAHTTSSIVTRVRSFIRYRSNTGQPL